jgi:membrane-bound serine protease (ClpP class)
VEIRGELWQATLRGQESLDVGSLVSVCDLEGLLLVVEPLHKPI